MEQTIITVELVDGIDIYEADNVYQYDRGDVLKLTGLTLPTGCQVHFGFSANGKSKPVLLSNGEAVIPQEFTNIGAPIYAWVYVSGEGYGATKKTIKIPVAHRGEITDEEPTPEQESTIDQYIALLQETTAEVEENYTELSGEVGDLKSAFGQVSSGVIGVNLASQIALEDGKALNEDGEVVNNSVAVLSDFIQVIPGYIYTVNQKLGSSVYCNCFYDSSFTLVESHLSNGTLPLTYTAPEGAKYLRAIGVKADKAAFEVMAVLTADGKSLANIDEIEQLKADAARIKYITPEEYGAKGDGVTDDRAAFVAMFDDANDYDTIVLGNKEYYISSNITVAKNFLKICSAFHRDEYRPCLSTNLSAAANVLLTFTGSGISIYDICFKNTSKAATFLYFDADNETANGNIDALVNNVCFMTGDAGVRTKGRNVRVYDCLFSNLNAAVRLNQTTLDTDNRGYEIVNNRIHYCGIGVQNGIDNARDNRNIVIANNFADGTAMLFTGKGGGVVIKDNVVDAYGSDNATFIVIEADQSGVLNRISGNVYHGIGASENRGIECRIGAVVDIVGNMLDGCDGLGLVIQGTSKIIDNTFTDCGSGSNMYVMAFGSQSNAVVVGNVMSGFANKYSVTSGGVVNYANNYPA